MGRCCLDAGSLQARPHLCKGTAHGVCKRADGVIEDAQIFAAIHGKRGRHGSKDGGQAGQQLPASSLLQSGQRAAGCLLHMPVVVAYPR